jgi:hypothetical protein
MLPRITSHTPLGQRDPILDMVDQGTRPLAEIYYWIIGWPRLTSILPLPDTEIPLL